MGNSVASFRKPSLRIRIGIKFGSIGFATPLWSYTPNRKQFWFRPKNSTEHPILDLKENMEIHKLNTQHDFGPVAIYVFRQEAFIPYG